jgi:hypothetical protein
MRCLMYMVFIGFFFPESTPAKGAIEASDLILPREHVEIALRVAGTGRPQCRSYNANGGESPCLPRFALQRGSGINGASLAGQITFTRSATTRLNQNEFALLAGHEIAHWYLGHRGSSIEAELAADRLGAELACRAGFDVTAGAELFRFLHSDRAHPKAEVRRRVVQEVNCGNGMGAEGKMPLAS